MAQVPPIDDAYIDSIIKSAGAYNPSLLKTQGIKLRELFKLMRDRMEQGDQVADGYLPLSGGSMTGDIQFTDQVDSGISWDRFTDYGKIFFESVNEDDTTSDGDIMRGRSSLVFLLGDDGHDQDNFVFRFHQIDINSDVDTFMISNDYLYMHTLQDGIADDKVLTIGVDRKIRERVIGRGPFEIMSHNGNGDTLIGRVAILGSLGSMGDDLSAGSAVQLTSSDEANTIGRAARMQLGDDGDIVFKTFKGPGDGTGSWFDRLRIVNASGTLDYSSDVSAVYTARSLVDKAYVDSRTTGGSSVIVDAIPTDGSNNAVSSNGVFDALALKADDSTVLHHSDLNAYLPLTGGTITGRLQLNSLENGIGDSSVLSIASDRSVRMHTIGRGPFEIMAHNENGDTLVGRVAILGATGSSGDDLSVGSAVQLANSSAVDASRAARMQLGDDGDIVFITFKGPGDGTGSWFNRVRIRNDSGNLEVQGSVTANSFVQSSQRALKDNIQLYTDGALDKINAIQINSFTYKSDEEKNFKVGFIADDTDPLFSTRNQDNMDLGTTLAVSLKAIQELSAEMSKLKERLSKYEDS